ncbi:MAG: Sulfate transport system permease protein CysW [Lentisphaerae bacterium ADurb.Bin242]|nr:MAG: Sulfate transport system permease protein CysW [Lentisphaerae bacterium ADurb.Bin242]
MAFHKTFQKLSDTPVLFRFLAGFAALLIVFLFLVLPLWVILKEAFGHGVAVWYGSISDPDTLSAIRLTLLTAAIVVPLNTVFGVIMAWALSKFQFRGRTFIIALIDMPFTVSPVVAGLIFILLLGPRNGWFGPWFESKGIHLVFSTPGIIIATLFVTFPFVARELIPLMREQGTEEEQAALTLGAGPWQMFRRVTLPNIKWGLLYGVILCTARSIGEFGAVSVVSGHIRGETNTMPLHVEILYNEYSFTAAFAVASLLSLVAVVTIVLKSLLERRMNEKESVNEH